MDVQAQIEMNYWAEPEGKSKQSQIPPVEENIYNSAINA